MQGPAQISDVYRTRVFSNVACILCPVKRLEKTIETI